MPGSTRTFFYSLTPKDPEQIPVVAAKARKILGWACDGDKRITCHDIEGEALGTVTLRLTITGRDRWWATQLAQDILNFVTFSLQKDSVDLDLQSWRLPPHMNRGYERGGRTKRYRERKKKPST